MPSLQHTEQNMQADRLSVRFEGPQCIERYDAWFKEHPGIGVLSVESSDIGEDPFIALEYCLPKARFH
jgi:hypothetical protein